MDKGSIQYNEGTVRTPENEVTGNTMYKRLPQPEFKPVVLENKHTPGPWRFDEEDYEYILSSEDTYGEWPIAQMRGWGRLQKLENGRMIQIANAKLIAAAPDLLDVCQSLISGNIHIEYVKEMARIAVNKAQGN